MKSSFYLAVLLLGIVMFGRVGAKKSPFTSAHSKYRIRKLIHYIQLKARIYQEIEALYITLLSKQEVYPCYILVSQLKI